MPDLRHVRVAAATLNQTPLDWEGNKRRIIEAIESAKAQQVSLLCLPELCISGYACEDMFHAIYVHEISAKMLLEIAEHTSNITVAVSLPVSFRGGVYNAAAVVSNKNILGFALKQHLPGDGAHYEPRWFKSWKSEQSAELSILGKKYPCGDLLFDIGNLRFGFEICQDAWVADRTGIKLSKRSVDLLLNPSASHFAFGKFEVRKRLVQEAARAFGVGYLYCNTLGNGAGRIVYDGETLIYAGSDWLAAGNRFSFQEWQIAIADIDIAKLRMQRAKSNVGQEAEALLPDLEVHAEFDYPEIETPTLPLQTTEWETSKNIPLEEFTRVTALGMFDYLHKTKAHGYVVNVSGGIDSAATAYIVYAMVKLGVAELGLDGFKKRLAHIPTIQQAQSTAELMDALLFCFYQRSENNSEESFQAATILSEGLGAHFGAWEIQPLVNHYLEGIESLVGRKLNWNDDNHALQNIQARVRAPSAWLIANLRNAVLLSTSNRSEAAVGYTTMDGDTCGGLSPIAGIDKASLRLWLSWCETEGCAEIGHSPWLSAVNQREPSAELQPPSYSQKDEIEIMPYWMLDVIQRKAVREKYSPAELWRYLCQHHPEIDAKELGAYVTRFFSLWAKTQWKRERYAPCFHIDDENLDPKTCCRFPLISGGFSTELAELEGLLAGI